MGVSTTNPLLRPGLFSRILSPVHRSFCEVLSKSNKFNYAPGQFQPIPPTTFAKLFSYGGFEPYQNESFKVLDETSLMVRKPFLRVKQFLERTDFSRPVNRFVLYGKYGTGKTYILNHLAYYGYVNEFILIHNMSPLDWIVTPVEHASSETQENRIDIPINAGLALRHFRSQNRELIEKLDLRTSETRTWSLREETPAGSPLLNIVDHGLARIKHGDDCFAALMHELKILANEGKCKLMVICDSVNLFYNVRPTCKHSDKRLSTVDEITLPRAFMKFFEQDWKNGVIIVSVNYPNRTEENNLAPYTPRFLLNEEVFRKFDPFIPIKVDLYDNDEFNRCYEYYLERNFITRAQAKTDSAKEEIRFLSGCNPYDMFLLCRAL